METRLFVTTLLLAEITRLKYGRKFSLAPLNIERCARQRFAQMVGISPRSKPAQFLHAIKQVYNDNQCLDRYYSTMAKFRVNPENYCVMEK